MLIVAHAGLAHTHIAGAVFQYAPLIIGAATFAVALIVNLRKATAKG